jgi:hypothetical protein
LERAWRFAGRGRPGEEERGSKAGRREGAGRLTPAVEGSEGSRDFVLLAPEGDEGKGDSMVRSAVRALS